MKNTYGVAVPKKEVERTLPILRELGLIDNTLRVTRTSEAVLIPLVREPSSKDIFKIKEHCANVRIEQALFAYGKTRPRDLLEYARGKIPEHLLSSLPHSFDIIGDIAIIELPAELIQFSSTIGNGVMEVNPHLRLVLRKSGEVSGRFRTRSFEPIAGTGKTETIHREFSCLFHLDIAKVYFNSRLSHERMRVASQVRKGECVLDMFAGVGPYSVLIAKRQPDSRVYSIDINPEAFRYLEENILLNGVADRVIPIFGDAGQLAASKLRATANRVIMNLPSESSDFLNAAVQALKEEGGIIHYYTFSSRSDDTDQIRDTVRSFIERQGRTVHSFPFSNIIKEVAPNRVQVAIDVLVK